MQAYRNADRITDSQQRISMLTEGIEQSGRAIILLSRERGIRDMTPKARHWLSTYFGSPTRGASQRLPESLNAWLNAQIKMRSETALVAHPAVPFSLKTDNGTLIVRVMIQDDCVLLLLEEQRPLAADDSALIHALESLGLGRRESQVLAWVAQGKTNPEIALILGISPRTIQTHLDRIYRKLDVTTRAAAVAKAMGARALAAGPV